VTNAVNQRVRQRSSQSNALDSIQIFDHHAAHVEDAVFVG